MAMFNDNDFVVIVNKNLKGFSRGETAMVVGCRDLPRDPKDPYTLRRYMLISRVVLTDSEDTLIEQVTHMVDPTSLQLAPQDVADKLKEGMGS